MATSSQLDISVEQSGKLERRMTVRVPNAEIEREIDARLRKVAKTARLKGFRPGKIPPKVVRRQYGGQVRQEVVSDVIRSSYSQAIAERKLNPAGGPSIEPLSGNDEHFSYRAVFEVYPDIELAEIDGLEIETPAVEIGEDDVDEMIENLRVQRAEWRTVERPAEAGDRVVIDFTGTIGKQAFEGGEGKDVSIVVGGGQVIDDFDKALHGVSAGDSKTAKVKFPKDYAGEALAGKKAVFDIAVHRVEEQQLPDVDDEFLKAFGIDEGGVDALRAEVRGNMQRELDERLRAERKQRAFDALLRANQIDLPQGLIEQQIGEMQAEAMRRLGIQDEAQAPARENFRPEAARRVALALLVQELVAKHQIALDRERVDARIKELAAPYEKPEEAEQMYRGSRDFLARLESAVLEDQVVDYIYEHGGARQKTMSFAELMNA